MPALAVRDDISSEELRRQARRERDGRVSARLIAIANALERLRLHLRDNRLSHGVFQTTGEIVDTWL